LKEVSKNKYYQLKDNTEKTREHKKNIEKQVESREKRKSIERKIEPQNHMKRARSFRERRQQQGIAKQVKELKKQIEKRPEIKIDRELKPPHKIDHSRGMDISF
ncbi:MAG: hypothetical protein GY739_21905, partial [Mesoflavibacter sp.]|nr:hypothetical protein [Mesoflavibacter sp.]